MAINVNSSATSYNFIFRNYYSKNRNAARAVTRSNITKDELVTADSDALSKIAKTLRGLEYSSDNGVGIYNNVKAFTDAYNNLISSTSGSVSYDVTHPNKLLKNLVKSKKDELEDIGISVAASGKLKLKKETLLQSSPKKIAKIFSSDSEFTQKVKYYSGKIYKASNNINLSSAGTSFTPASKPDTSNTSNSTTGEAKKTFNAIV
ncbi:MAG TPA: hypothetical protein DCZ23_06645 [Lachnospiraceae bacterium]|nr:hypothetical protein [Lachnospiraceae bacterium]